MSKQEAIELFNKGNLIESSNLFKDEITNTTDDNLIKDCLEYLVVIHKKLNKVELQKFQIDLLEKYCVLDEHESLIDLFESTKISQFKFRRLYLDALWKTTNISKFDLHAQKLCEDILTEKLFVDGKDFLIWLKGTRKWTLYPRFTLTLLFIDLGFENEALSELKEIEELICSKWSKIEKKKKNQKEYLLHISHLLSKYEFFSFELISYKELLKAKLYILDIEKVRISKKELISLVIIFSTSPKELSYLIPLLEDSYTEEYLKYIKDFNVKGLFHSESPFSFLGDYFTVKRNVNIVKNSNKQYFPTSYNIENIKDEYDSSIFEEYLGKEKKTEDIERNELYFKSLIRHSEEIELVEKESLVVALVELNLFDSAQLLLEKLEDSPNLNYLKSEIHLKERKFTEVIITVNEALEHYELTEMERIPFYYLKAMAYLNLSKDVEAQNIFSLIESYNPDFRSIKERLFSD